MRLAAFSVTFLASLTIATSALANEGTPDIAEPVASLPELSGPYLGQKTPGLVAEPFAPGIISTERWEYNAIFTPDMREFYVFRDDGRHDPSSVIVYRQGKGGEWREVSASRRQGGTPTIAPDGKTMHLGRTYLERTDDGWSERKGHADPFQAFRIMRMTESESGTYYFDEVGSEDGDGRIRYSRIVDGQRQAPQLASEAINTGTMIAHPFIAPDESYILWDGRREGGLGGSDIYVNFRQPDGSWGEAINLGDRVNTPSWEAAASVTPDGKYLFFNRAVGEGNVDIYWVDARILEELRPKEER